jgi:xanthine dehydrogenase YagS FAD-binding subunit
MLLELPYFQHLDAKSVMVTTSWLQKYGDRARVLAGATDLLSLMKDRIEGPKLKIPEVLVNIKTIPNMNRITHDEKIGLRIGAAATVNDLEKSDVIGQKFNILSEAAQQIGTTPIRNMGTVGGNLCQRPRCMYFRHPHFICFKKGGTRCFAITGEHRYYHSILAKGKCVMAHPSDLAPALVALKANAIIASSDGEKEVSFQDFFTGPNNLTENILRSDEFLKEVQIPNQDGTYQLFLKHRIRHAADFALCSVAMVVEIIDKICNDIRIVLGGLAPFPYVASAAEALGKGERLSEKLISQVGEASVEGAQPLTMNRYKVDLAKTLVKRALTSIWHKAIRG